MHIKPLKSLNQFTHFVCYNHASNKVFDIKVQLVFNKLLNIITAHTQQWKIRSSLLMKFIRKSKA